MSEEEPEELKLYNFRFYPSTIAEIDALVNKDRNASNRAEWFRQKIEYLISNDLINQLPGEIDVESIVKEIMLHLSDRIQNHENRMYERVANLERTLSKIINKVESQDPDLVEINKYLEAISTQLFVDQLELTLSIDIPAKLIKLLRYNWYGDYIADWINQQKELETLNYDGRIIRWNRERIEEVYRIE